MLRVIFLFLFCSSLFANNPLSISVGTSQPKKISDVGTIDYINNLRKLTGLAPLTLQPKLSKAAKAHAQYILNNQDFSHYEKSGFVNFTGETPNDRAKVAGYLSFVSEGISYGDFSELQSVDQLMTGIYHRFNLLTFDNDEIGIAYFDTGTRSIFVHENGSSLKEKLCAKSKFDETTYKTFIKSCLYSNILVPKIEYDLAQKNIQDKQPEYIIFPPNGAVDILPAFFEESPHPLPGSMISGYPITVQFNPNVKYKPDLISATLTSNNQEKPVKILNKLTDPNVLMTEYQFAILPLDRLDYDTSYTVKLDLKIKDRLKQKIITFKTMKAPAELITIHAGTTKLKLKENIKYTLYFPPAHNKDVIKYLHVKADYLKKKPEITYDLIDANTISFMMSNADDADIQLDLNNGKILNITK